MNPKTLVFSLMLGLIAAAACLAGNSDVEKVVRNADEEWSKVAATKDVDKMVAFYADNAMVLPPNAPMVISKAGIRDLWKGFFDSLTDISWKTTHVQSAKSGEMALLIGTYEVTMKDGTKDKGKYSELWKKQPDGKWKCETDMFSSDLPAANASASPAETK
jgi:ketosteroid isomerase-like protein